MSSIRILHLVDTLQAAGKERVAVNLANLIQRGPYLSYLCTTRDSGSLRDQLRENVVYHQLDKSGRFDLRALRRLVCFISSHKIDIIHAHNASLFLAAAASIFPPFPSVIWHDHYVTSGAKERPVWLYRLGVLRARGVIAVSEPLGKWIREKLKVPSDRVWYIPNFVNDSKEITASPALPGTLGYRIVCVAHFRPQKDHMTLIRAMSHIIQREPRSHLILIGTPIDTDYFEILKKEISVLNLDKHISFLGERLDIYSILKKCTVGVLSSAGEGFPLVLLEYGISGLSVVATKVGQCEEILDDGRAGLLVPSRSPLPLANSILQFLESPEMCSKFGQNLKNRIELNYSSKCVEARLCRIYDEVFKGQK